MRRAWLLVALVTLLWPALPARAQAQAEPLIVGPGERIEGNVATLDRSITVEGEVLGDVTSWSGDIRVRGHVHGDVVSYSGGVAIAPGAMVDGSVLALMGKMSADATAAVGGRRFAPQPPATTASLVRLVSTGTPPPLALRVGLAGALALLLVALCLLFPAVWPRRSAAALSMLRRRPWFSLGFGLLTGLLLLLLLPSLVALLALTLVGLLLVLPLLLLLGLLYGYGLAVLAQLVGQRLGWREPLSAGVLGGLLLVLPLAALAVLAPLSSLALVALLASAGLGAAALSRGGTLLISDYM